MAFFFTGFNILAYLMQGLPANMVGAVLVLGNSYSASVCILIFAKDIQKGVIKLLCKTQLQVKTTDLPLQPRRQRVMIPLRRARIIS